MPTEYRTIYTFLLLIIIDYNKVKFLFKQIKYKYNMHVKLFINFILQVLLYTHCPARE